ncbi:MAG: Na/Pi cotransporter family protein [Clostridia bacterium]|nr:Na/Pi cotransporter family protein [Clostridia bacterium]
MEIVFTVIKLLGGLALFLYGMRLMGDNLKESSSGTLKIVMEKVTDNPVKAFLLGIAVTAVIQSSTACIVITSGLVSAGVIKFRQSLGIIIGANVGTTVTGQIIRLLDINAEGSFLQFFQPSTLAPVALIIGIVLIMFIRMKKSQVVGNIALGFGILFTGLINMTGAVSGLTGVLGNLFTNLGDNPFLGYLSGAGVAFVLQSSSATIGILQAFSTSFDLPFYTVYIIIVGIYLGDCVTTAIVCSIGSKADAKRVGLVNILFNLSETVVVLVAVNLAHGFGWLDGLWDKNLTPGSIANTNTIFNLGCAILLLPMVNVYAKISEKLIKDKPGPENKYATHINALNPIFFSTPALAFKSCYDALRTMLTVSRGSIDKAISLLFKFDQKIYDKIDEEEDNMDTLADRVSEYLVRLSPHITEQDHVLILDQYYKLVNEFEKLSDYAKNISIIARDLNAANARFSDEACREIGIAVDLLSKILDYSEAAFEKRDFDAAKHIEPYEEVMDDIVNALHDNHIERLREGTCNIEAGACFLDVMSNLEYISDSCSNIGVAIVARVSPEVSKQAHMYISSLHQGSDEWYNDLYHTEHDEYFARLGIKAEGTPR